MIATNRKLGMAMDGPKLNDTVAKTPKVTMPSQTIEFAVSQGLVTLSESLTDVNGFPIAIRGDLTLDNQLNMVARVPLDATWLKPELRGKPGEIIRVARTRVHFSPRGRSNSNQQTHVNHLRRDDHQATGQLPEFEQRVEKDATRECGSLQRA